MPRQPRPPTTSVPSETAATATAVAATPKTTKAKSVAAIFRIPLLCLACVCLLKVDVSSLEQVRGLYYTDGNNDLTVGQRSQQQQQPQEQHQHQHHATVDGAIDRNSRIGSRIGSSSKKKNSSINNSNNINNNNKNQSNQNNQSKPIHVTISNSIVSFLDAYLPDMEDLASLTNSLFDDDDDQNPDDEEDLHYFRLDVLDLLDWEQESLTGLLDKSATDKSLIETCNPPNGISRTCCVGSFSMGGGVSERFRSQCVLPMQSTDNTSVKYSNAITAHQRLQQATKAYFKANRLNRLDDNTKQNRCDICRIVDLARHQNLTIALMGDSMHSQVSDGLLCELQRRNYIVTSEYIDHNPQKDNSYIFRKHTLSQLLTIRSPTWESNQVVTIQYSMMYLLPLINNAVLELTAKADVVVLGFGLHWWHGDATPHVFKRQSSYVSAMQDVFHNITQQNHVQLLVHRETSAQHFDSNGGGFSEWWDHHDQRQQQCQPMNYSDSSVGWRETAIQQAANQSGHDLIIAGPHMPPSNNINAKNQQHQPEVVVLPYFDFTSQLHSLHPLPENGFQDCTHYCSSPFTYYPLWRSLRFAMERQFG